MLTESVGVAVVRKLEGRGSSKFLTNSKRRDSCLEHKDRTLKDVGQHTDL